MERVKNNTIVQNAYVVSDLKAAIERWSITLGVGPFFVMENVELDCVYRGQASKLELSVAMAQAGPLNIELIQQMNEEPSVYRDIYGPNDDDGFHHVCMLIDNFDEEIKRYRSLGYEIAFEADMGVYRFCYVDTFKSLGYMIELVEDGPEIGAIYNKVRESAEGWDGTHLIRPLYS